MEDCLRGKEDYISIQFYQSDVRGLVGKKDNSKRIRGTTFAERRRNRARASAWMSYWGCGIQGRLDLRDKLASRPQAIIKVGNFF